MTSTNRSITIPAAVGGIPGIYSEGVGGRFFVCISSSAEFQVAPDDIRKLSMTTGRAASSAERSWNRLVFYNTSANDITVEYYSGESPYQGNIGIASVAPTVATTVKDASTYTKGSTAATNATTTFNGLDGTAQRKQIIVFNDEASGGANIGVVDNAGVGVEVPPQQALTLVTNGIIKVVVGSGVTAAKVLETFYDE